MDLSTPELEPFVLCEASTGRCATWRIMAGGQQAVALFKTREQALAYCQTAALVGDWKAMQPDRRQLAQLFQAALDSGVRFAVLDPDANAAQRVFQLEAMQEALRHELQ